MSLGEFLQRDNSLSEEEMMAAMTIIMDGKADEGEITAFLIELAERGESVSEITGAARVMREKAITLNAPENAIDCCGTGGDASGTYNISTAVAIVAASCGVPIAKHGGGASTSKSGSVDVLVELGVNIDVDIKKLEEAFSRFNFAFLAAPRHHSAMKNVREVRKKIGRRTVFNLLGPLANPSGTKFQLLGVYDAKWMRPMAEVVNRLGTVRAWVVHGSDRLDEITVTGETRVVILDEGKITEAVLSPADFGLAVRKAEELKGGDAKVNAAAMREILQGAKNAYRDIVLANAAAVLVIHGRAKDLKQGVNMAAEAIDSGKAMQTLNGYAEFTQ